MKLKTPHHLLLLTAILTYIVGLFQSKHTFDLHLRDTYYVISGDMLIPLLSIIPLMFWLIYMITWKYLFSKQLGRIHVFVTVLSILIIVSFFLFSGDYYKSVSATTGGYYIDWNNFPMPFKLKLFIASIVLLIIAQCIHLIDLAKGLYKRVQKVSNFL